MSSQAWRELLGATRAKTRRPDIVALVPSGAGQPSQSLLLLIEVTVTRAHSLEARSAEKRLKYADVTAGFGHALAPHGVAVDGPLVVALSEEGALSAGLQRELLERVGRTAAQAPARAVDELLADLVRAVRSEHPQPANQLPINTPVAADGPTDARFAAGARPGAGGRRSVRSNRSQ